MAQDEIGIILQDVVTFLESSLSSCSLPASVKKEKADILSRIVVLRNKHPEFQPKKKATGTEDEEIYSDVVVGEKPAAKADDTSSQADEAAGEQEVSAAEAESNSLKSGYLVKKNGSKFAMTLGLPEGFIKKPNSKRWSVLTKEHLYCFEKQNSKKQLFTVQIANYECQPFSETHKKKEFGFELNCSACKSYTFVVPSSEELNTWLGVFAKVGVRCLPIEEVKVKEKNKPDSEKSDKPDLDNPEEDYVDPDELLKKSAEVKSISQERKEKTVATLKSYGAALTKLTGSVTSFFKNKAVPAASGTSEDSVSKISESDSLDSEVIYEDANSTTLEEEKGAGKEADKFGKDKEYEEEIYDDTVGTGTDEIGKAVPVIPQGRPGEKKKVPEGNSEMSDKPELWNDYENIYYGLWDCMDVQGDNELAFKRGDLLRVIAKEYDAWGWWVVQVGHKIGIVPKAFLTPAYESY